MLPFVRPPDRKPPLFPSNVTGALARLKRHGWIRLGRGTDVPRTEWLLQLYVLCLTPLQQQIFFYLLNSKALFSEEQEL